MMKAVVIGQVDLILNKIQEKRIVKGYTLENMADELGLSTGSYYKLEKKLTKLTLERLFEIQRILDINLYELYEEFSGLIPDKLIDDNDLKNQNMEKLYDVYKDNMELIGNHIDSLESEIKFLRSHLQKVSI